MNTLLRFALATAFATTLASPAGAGELHLSIANGHVTLRATDVTISQILAEWARVGQTRIVNGEKLVGGPVTIELIDVPEAQALDSVLRTAAGYVMAPRLAGTPGASMYDRILILASSRPPVVTATTQTPFTARPMPQMQNMVPDDEGEFGQATGANIINPLAGPPVAIMPPNAQPGVTQAPLTATRPGQLPAPTQTAQPSPNPYLGTPPGPTSPTFNPQPQPPTTTTPATRPGPPNTGRGGGA